MSTAAYLDNEKSAQFQDKPDTGNTDIKCMKFDFMRQN